MGTIMFKSGIRRFLRIYNTYNLRQENKSKWVLRNTLFARIKIHQHCAEVYTIQASEMTHSKFILNKTAVDFRFNRRMKNTDKNAVYCILYFYRVWNTMKQSTLHYSKQNKVDVFLSNSSRKYCSWLLNCSLAYLARIHKGGTPILVPAIYL
jgi:hypothetical protein